MTLKTLERDAGADVLVRNGCCCLSPIGGSMTQFIRSDTCIPHSTIIRATKTLLSII